MAARKQYEMAEVGEIAPTFRLPALDGGIVTLSQLTAKGPALLVFFKITCPVCQFALPYVQRIHAKGGLTIYGISQDGAGDTREFMKEFGVTFPMLLDQEEHGFPVSNAYGISHVPSLFLVGTDGKIQRAVESWSKAEMEALGALAGVRVIQPGERVPDLRPG